MYFKKIIGRVLLVSYFFSNCFYISAIDIKNTNNKNILDSSKNFKNSKLSSNKKDEYSIDELPAKSYILTNYETGQILYEKNADERLHIASITKIMTMLLVVEAIQRKEINLTDYITITKDAKPSQNESSIWVEVGEKISVSDLLKAVAVNSANDAARALAIGYAGSEQAFVEMMNKRAKELGMENTHFTNASGLDDEDNYSSARDVAIMAKELLKHNWITNYTKIQIEKNGIMNGKIGLYTTNKLLTTYKGCNGLKTGTEEKAGKCLCATAIRGKIPLCAISLGSENDSDRWNNCTTLLDYGFNNFQKLKVDKNKIEELKVSVNKGKQNFVKCKTTADKETSYLIKKTQIGNVKQKIDLKEYVLAPIKENDIVGEISYVDEKENVIFKRNVYAAENVEKLEFLFVFKRLLKNFFTGSKFYD